MDDFEKNLKEQLTKDKEFKKEYERLAPRYKIIKEILKIRHELNLTQKELAKKVGTTQSYISRIENGNADLGVDFLMKLLHSIGYDISFKKNKSAAA